MTPAPLSYWLHAFFHDWLGEQRNCSRHTILSYRDTWC
jgi:DNA-directed RNA polymerase subunit N (RpoN/RPB10)